MKHKENYIKVRVNTQTKEMLTCVIMEMIGDWAEKRRHKKNRLLGVPA